MQPHLRSELTLSLRPDPEFLPLATTFVEQAALVFGLGREEALSLTVATEEIFTYLCEGMSSDEPLVMTCSSGGYYVTEEFRFAARHFDMRAFNLTARASFDDDAAAPETGLLIASRMVDRFRFAGNGAGLTLTLVKEKAYPQAADVQAPSAQPLKDYSVRAPQPEELKLFVLLVNAHYPPELAPASFAFPGKIVDMVACGEFVPEIAVDEAGRIGGGIVRHWDGMRLVEFFGPYVFNQPAGSPMARDLVDACINAIARTSAVGLITRYPTPELPEEYFERLGSLMLLRTDGVREFTAFYRHLQEDAGATVWAHPSIEAFLKAEYRRLAFAREILPVRDDGELSSPFSVLSAEFDRGGQRVTLRPIWWGGDAADLVAAHVDVLTREHVGGLLFEMDLGKPWQCHFAPALLKCGFVPRLVLPYAGRGDLVVFQHSAGEPQR